MPLVRLIALRGPYAGASIEVTAKTGNLSSTG
jgi:hypothetical protein